MGGIRMRWSWSALCLLLCAAACQQGASKTYVVLDFKGTSSAPIHSIDLTLTLGSHSDTTSFTTASRGDVALPTSAALDIGSGDGELTVWARAYDGSGAWVAEGSNAGMVSSGQSTSLTIALAPPHPDAGVDGSAAQDAPGPGNDGADNDGASPAPADGGGGTLDAWLVDGSEGMDSAPDRTGTGGSDGTTTVDGTGGMGGLAGASDAASGGSADARILGSGGKGGGADGAGLGGSGANKGTGGSTSASSTGVQLMILPQPLDFGAVMLGTTSSPQTLTISNAGDQLTAALTLSVDDSRSFSIVQDHCSGVVLEPGSSCTIVLTFQPNAIGFLQTSGSVIAGQGLPFTFVLTGQGLNNAPEISMSPNSVDFNMIDVGLSSSMEFKVTGSGGSDPGTLDVVLDGGPGFSVVSNGCANVSLPAGGRCTFTLMFIPTTFGRTQTAITVKSSSGASATSYGSGTGRDFVDLSVKLAGTGSGTVIGGGLSCKVGNPCALSIARTDANAVPKVSLTGQPDQGSLFAGWSGSCTSSATCDLTMDGSKYVTATFNLP